MTILYYYYIAISDTIDTVPDDLNEYPETLLNLERVCTQLLFYDFPERSEVVLVCLTSHVREMFEPLLSELGVIKILSLAEIDDRFSDDEYYLYRVICRFNDETKQWITEDEFTDEQISEIEMYIERVESDVTEVVNVV